MAGSETNSEGKTKRRKTAKHAEACLTITASTFSEESVRRIIDDWLASFCRKTYKLLINQEKPIIQDQTSDKLERRSGCGFPARRRSGESNCSLPSRSGLVGKLRVAGQRAEPPDWELNRKFSEGSDSGLSR